MKSLILALVAAAAVVLVASESQAQCKNGRCFAPQLSQESCPCDCTECPNCDCHRERYYAGGPRGPRCEDAKRGPVRKAAAAAKRPLRAAAKAAKRPLKAIAKAAKALRPFKRCRG